MDMKTKGLVLREVAYKEHDKILTVLTEEHGKMTMKARGCRRKGSQLAASSQLLVYSDMTLFEYRDFTTMREAESLNQFWGVRQDIEKLAMASYFAEVVDAVADEGQPDPALMSLILNSLYALDKLDKPQLLVKSVFELKLLAVSGYEPALDGCAVCGYDEPEQPRLDLTEGVLHCHTCKVSDGISMPMNHVALAAMRHVVCGDPKRLFSFPMDGTSMDGMSNLSEAFLLTQLERGFHTLDFYKQLKYMQPPQVAVKSRSDKDESTI